MNKTLYLIPCFLLIACIGDDFVYDEVEPVIRILNTIDTLEINATYQFEVRYFNNVGVEVNLSNYLWESSSPQIINIDSAGLATALQHGSSIISVTGQNPEGQRFRDEKLVTVGNRTVSVSTSRMGTLKTTSSYSLQGDFSLENTASGVTLIFSDNYEASTALPGLYVYLTNNPNTIDNALEIGQVKVFKGKHNYEIMGAQLREYSHVLYYCKPFRVKIGDGPFVN